MKDKNTLIGFILLGLLFIGFMYVNNKEAMIQAEEQRIQDSIAQVAQLEKDSIQNLNIITSEGDSTKAKLTQTELDSLKRNRLFFQYGAFAMSAVGEEKDIELSSSKIKVNISTKGGNIKKVNLLDYKKKVFNEEKEEITSPLLLMNDERNTFGYEIPVNGVANKINTKDLFFEIIEQRSDKLVLRAYAGSPDKYFEQTYTINGEYELDYDIQFKNLGDVVVGGTDNINLNWVNYLDRIERSTDYEKINSTIYFKEVDDNMSYCGCQGDDTQEVEKRTKWVAHSNQFFNAALIADNGFGTMTSSTTMPTEEEKFLKKLTTDLAVPYSNNSTFGMSFYTGPKEYNRLSAVGDEGNDLELEETIAYGRSILGTINRYVIRPLFGLFSGFIGNKGIVILIITILIKLLLFPLTYKMLYSQAKMAALKPQIEALKKKIGDDSQAQQVETMKLYRETGVNPLGGCLPMVIQMPIWIALYRFFPASIEFRQESFLWATDLASFDVITWLPIDVWFYGEHISLFTILWAVSTVAYSYYNSKHMDMSANPAMKYVQYLMPIMFLFFFNSFAASLTCYMFFSSLFNIAQTLITKNVIINKDKVEKELSEYKKKPKKKGGFQSRLETALKQAQDAQEQREKNKQRKKK